VGDLESVLLLERPLEAAVGHALREQLLRERGVCALGNDALLVENREDALRLALDELDDLGVVNLGHVSHLDVDVLLGILLHRRVEDGLVEGSLQLLVGEVDAELRGGGVRERRVDDAEATSRGQKHTRDWWEGGGDW
jgi:hypothetical protein